MIISRRQFLKYCTVAAGALGLTATDLMRLKDALALEGGVKVTWIQGQSCTGCTVSLANSVYYATIQDLLLNTPAATSLDLNYHQTLMSAMSNEATQATDVDIPTVLVVEGAIPPAASGCCEVGSFTGASGESVADVVTALANKTTTAYILAVGTCAAYGGIPAGNPNPTGAKGVLDFAKSISNATYKAWRKKTINIPGCPPNPNWIVGTIAYLIGNGAIPQLDSLRRPRTYYGERICNSCERFGKVFINNNTPDDIGDPTQTTRCLKKVGCKGSRTKSDCSLRKWHSPGFGQVGVNWCVGAGAPCQGCTQNFFPDRMSPFHYIR
jgi:hydrogenase small subunit